MHVVLESIHSTTKKDVREQCLSSQHWGVEQEDEKFSHPKLHTQVHASLACFEMEFLYVAQNGLELPGSRDPATKVS